MKTINEFKKLKKIPWTDINSSMIVQQHYDTVNKVLYIKFANLGVHAYENISLRQFKSFMGASSLGSHFSKFIKPLPSIKLK